MAGETRGELAEAIAKVALEKALVKLGRKEEVFWQKSPDGAVIQPDFTIGLDEAVPLALVLVNACESPRNSDMKYWRNVGEIFDSKSRLKSSPSVLNLVFRSEIKPELIRLTEAICDETCHVDRDPVFGPPITQWLDANHDKAPKERKDKAAMVEAAVAPSSATYDAAFAKALRELTAALSSKLFTVKSSLQPLWDLCQKDYLARHGLPARKSKETLLRRGLARWLVFEDGVRQQVLKGHLRKGKTALKPVPSYTTALGMLKTSIGYAEIPPADEDASKMVDTTSRDLRSSAQFFLDAAGSDVTVALAAVEKALADVPAEMESAADQLRKMTEQVSAWHDFVLAQWEEITDPWGCYKLLQACAQDPSMEDRVPGPISGRVWIWDHAVAMIRAKHDRDNDFGYGFMVGVVKASLNEPKLAALFKKVLGELSGRQLKTEQRWVYKTLPSAAEPARRGFQDWLAGNKKNLSSVIVAALAYALSRKLKEIKRPEKIGVADIIESHAYSFWNKLLTHQDFEPLPALIEAACGTHVSRRPVSSLMGELGGATVQDAGRMSVYVFEGGLISWKSATEAGLAHKRKELCARARALRFAYRRSKFCRRPGIERMYLVLDGEWRDEDMKVFMESGWDAVFYPDEMDHLAALVGASTPDKSALPVSGSSSPAAV